MTHSPSPAEAVQLYIDGVRGGDVAALETAFHSDARMFGALAGQRIDVPIADLIGMAAAQPGDVDGTFKATVRSLEEHGDIAVAVVDEENFWGSVNFTDVLTLARFEEGWKIVGKAFTHTGGLPPLP